MFDIKWMVRYTYYVIEHEHLLTSIMPVLVIGMLQLLFVSCIKIMLTVVILEHIMLTMKT